MSNFLKTNLIRVLKYLMIYLFLTYPLTLFAEPLVDIPLKSSEMKQTILDAINTSVKLALEAMNLDEYKDEASLLCDQNYVLTQLQMIQHYTMQAFQEITTTDERSNQRLTKRNMYNARITTIEEISSGKYIMGYDSRTHFNYTTADGDHPLESCNNDRSDGLLSFTNFCYHSLNLKQFFYKIYFNKINIRELAFRLTVWNCEEGVDWAYGWHDELPFLFPFRDDGLLAHPESVITQCKKEISYIKEAIFYIQEFSLKKIEYENEMNQLQTQRIMHNENITQHYNDISNEAEVMANLCNLQQSITDINQNRDKVQKQLNLLISKYDMSNTNITQLINFIKSNLGENNLPEEEFLKNFIIALEKIFSSNNQRNQINLSQLQNFLSNSTHNDQVPFLYDTINSMILNSDDRIRQTQERIANTQEELAMLEVQTSRKTKQLESISLELSKKLYGGNVTIHGSKKVRLYKLLTEIPAFSLRFHIVNSYSERGPWRWTSSSFDSNSKKASSVSTVGGRGIGRFGEGYPIEY